MDPPPTENPTEAGRPLWRRALTHWPALVTLAIGLSVTVWAHDATCRSAERAAEHEFHAVCSEATTVLVDRLERYTSALKWGRGFVYSSTDVTREEWGRYVDVGRLGERYPGAYGLAFIERVPEDELDDFVARERADGAPGFEVREHSGPEAQPGGASKYVIRFHEPAERNRAALGVDLATRVESERLYNRAMTTGEVQLSRAIRLYQDEIGEQGVVMVIPLYADRSTPTTEAERVERLTGWIGLPVGMTTFLDREGLVDPATLGVRIHGVDASGAPAVLCASHPTERFRAPAWRHRSDVQFGGTVLGVEYIPGDEQAFRPNTAIASMMLAGGGVVSVLLAGIVLATTRTRVRAERIAADRSAHLRESEARAVELAREAEGASRAKSSFLAHMSHEIRTPMNAILGYAEVLEDCVSEGSTDPEAIADHVRTIHRNGDYLLTIINDILDISKIESGRLTLERVDTGLRPLLTSVERLMSVRANECGIGLRTEFADGLPETIATDPVRLRQVLVNLIGNAIKFTERGAVTVRASVVGDEKPRVRIEVIDTGIGIAHDQLDHIFEPFAQADSSITRRFGGTGLGLQISSSLIALLGGTIEATSRLGEGSVFAVEVPTSAGEGAKAAIADTPPTGPARAGGGDGETRLDGLRVLLVDDGPDNRHLLSHHLRRAGAEVTTANDGLEALEEITLDGPGGRTLPDAARFDLVITDIQMPGIDGYRLTELLRGMGWSRPIIAMTAHAMSSDEERCYRAGCSHFATKPIAKPELLALCAEAHAGHARQRAA